MKRDKLDSLFSHYIKLLSGGYCAKCKKFFGLKSRGLHCAHYHSRGKKVVRWDRDNATSLCYYHHIYFDRHPTEKAEFWIGLIGQERFNALNERANKPQKPDIEAIEADLKEKIRILEEE